MTSLNKRVALVTGGGRGIGRAESIFLASQGAKVVVCDSGTDPHGQGSDSGVAAQVVREITQGGGDAHGIAVDISTATGAAAAVASTVEVFGTIDIVVNNAGIVGGGSIATFEEQDVRRIFDVNFWGALWVCKAAWPQMASQGRGRVINTVSEVALDPRLSTGGVGYGPAKASVWSLTLTLAKEGAAHGITVNAVSPAAVTRLNEQLLRGTNAEHQLDPLHVAEIVGWFARDDTADVTGRVVHVAGENLREYQVFRHSDTPLLRRIGTALSGENVDDGLRAP